MPRWSDFQAFLSRYTPSASSRRYYHLSALATPEWGFLRRFHNGGRRPYCPTHAVRRELYHHGFEHVAIRDRGMNSEQFSPVHRSRQRRSRLGAGSRGRRSPRDGDALAIV